jgi:hypothetical protein
VQLLHYHLGMPLLQRFLNCAIYINARDHSPPHFHIRMSDGREAWVDIVTLEILQGSVPRREIKDALEWALNKRTLLLAKFKEYNQ